jgi:hypothetical protein
VSSTVERVNVSRAEAAHSRAAELVKRQRQLCERLDQFFREVAEVKERLRAEGSLWDGPVYDPPVEAAFNAWVSRGPRETRVELDRIADPPLMRHEAPAGRAALREIEERLDALRSVEPGS